MPREIAERYIRFGGHAAALLVQMTVPVWLRIESVTGALETTPVYPYHPARLAAMLAGRRDPDLLRKTGRLGMDVDEEELAAHRHRPLGHVRPGPCFNHADVGRETEVDLTPGNRAGSVTNDEGRPWKPAL